MKKNFQLTIDPMTDKKDIKEAKAVVKSIDFVEGYGWTITFE